MPPVEMVLVWNITVHHGDRPEYSAISFDKWAEAAAWIHAQLTAHPAAVVLLDCELVPVDEWRARPEVAT